MLQQQYSAPTRRTPMSIVRAITVLLCVCFAPCAHAQKSKPIEKEEIAKWINRMEECPADQPPYFSQVDYYDFKGDGTQQAIVVASTCMTGTAGPDIHSVLSRNSDGELEEMKIAEVDPKTYDGLFGNSNYTLSVEKGLLVAAFTDGSNTVTIKYKWNGKEFAVASIDKPGTHPTSFDCTKSLTEVEQNICHVESLAALDVQLNTLYKSLLTKLTGPERDALRDEQRKWLAARETTCNYKGWHGCLTDYYQKRIDTLTKPAETPAPAKAANPA
jgi:uncharacterized protein YecT (DUF1311 family)